MSERKINLEEIWMDAVNNFSDNGTTWDIARQAMKEACKQILVLAAENALMMDQNYPEDKFRERCVVHKNDPDEDLIIDTQSILNTINQVE